MENKQVFYKDTQNFLFQLKTEILENFERNIKMFNNQGKEMEMQNNFSYKLYIPAENVQEFETIARNYNIIFTRDPLKTTEFEDGMRHFYVVTGKIEEVKAFWTEIVEKIDLIQADDEFKNKSSETNNPALEFIKKNVKFLEQLQEILEQWDDLPITSQNFIIGEIKNLIEILTKCLNYFNKRR